MMTTTQETNQLADALLYLGENNRDGAIEKLRGVLRDLEHGKPIPNVREAFHLGVG